MYKLEKGKTAAQLIVEADLREKLIKRICNASVTITCLVLTYLILF